MEISLLVFTKIFLRTEVSMPHLQVHSAKLTSESRPQTVLSTEVWHEPQGETHRGFAIFCDPQFKKIGEIFLP